MKSGGWLWLIWLLYGWSGVGKCPFLGILNITFKYLLEFIFSIIGWCETWTSIPPPVDCDGMRWQKRLMWFSSCVCEMISAERGGQNPNSMTLSMNCHWDNSGAMNHQPVEQTEKKRISNRLGWWWIFMQLQRTTSREIHQPLEGRPVCLFLRLCRVYYQVWTWLWYYPIPSLFKASFLTFATWWVYGIPWYTSFSDMPIHIAGYICIYPILYPLNSAYNIP